MHRLGICVFATLFGLQNSLPGQPVFGQNADPAEQRGLLQLIRETEDSLTARRWLDAAERLNVAWSITCEREDPLLLVSGTDVRQLAPGETEITAGGKSRLESLFRNSPPEFRAEYHRQFADLAASEIASAIRLHDFDNLRRLTNLHAFCPAAETGLRVLAKRAVDREDYLEAALFLEQLTRTVEVRKTPQTALQQAVCYARAGLADDAADVLRSLAAGSSGATIVIGERTVTLPQSDDGIMEWLNEVAPGRLSAADSRGESEGLSAFAWTQPGGNYRRSAEQVRVSPGFRPGWSTSLFEVRDVLYSDQYNPVLSEYQAPIANEATRRLKRNSTILPAATPVIVDDRVIVRTPFGIRALELQSGELLWEVTRPDSRLRSAIDMLTTRNQDRRSPLSTGSLHLTDPRAPLFHQMVRTNTAAQMAVNGRTLFVIDECSGATWRDEVYAAQDPFYVVPPNFIRAYDVETGLFLWEAGGQTQKSVRPRSGNSLAGFYFLGTPLVLGQRTYVLAESSEGIFLIELVGPHGGAGETSGEMISDVAPDSSGFPAVSLNPRVVRSQILTYPEIKLGEHPVRAHAGLVPSFAQGLLICPTCDQRIVAVSASDQSLRWVFRYAGDIRTQEIGGSAPVLFGSRNASDSITVDMDSRWVDSLPRILGDRVIVTPRDADQLFCLDLHSGRELWKVPRSGYHGIGGAGTDRVILVGNQRAAALSLTDGRVLWSTELTEGLVCGLPVCDGEIISIPVDSPAIVSLDLRNGRRLVNQPLNGSVMPGNLQMTDRGLLTQNFSNLQFHRSIPEGVQESDTKADLVTETSLLLQRRTDEARALLETRIAAFPEDRQVREMLAEVLLEDLRTDFGRYRTEIPRVRELIESLAEDIHIAPLMHSLLGMNLTDAATVNQYLQSRSSGYQTRLAELIAVGMTSVDGATVEDLTLWISQLLHELPTAGQEPAVSGLLTRSRAAVLVAGIRTGLKDRSSEERRLIESAISDTAMEILRQQTDDDARYGFLTALRLMGFAGLAERATATASELNPPSRLMRLMAVLSAHERAMQAGSSGSVVVSPSISPSQTVLWSGLPEVSVSDERTVGDLEAQPEGTPQQLIPIYGDPQHLRNWSLVRVAFSGDIYAFDADGAVRFRIAAPGMSTNARFGYAASSFGFVHGPLLAINLNQTLLVVDTSQLNDRGEAAELWQLSLERLAFDSEAGEFRDQVAPADRIPQYFPVPAGFYPTGGACSFGIPVISGRRLLLLDLLSGRRIWQLDGIARDVVLLCSGDQLLLLSESSRQIEVRSLADGSIQQIARLPEWWGDANFSVGSSVRDIEVEDGVDLLWRITFHGHFCVLFRVTAGRSVLECRNLLTDTEVWSMSLPQETVFSNVDHETVALLSDGDRLKLVNTSIGELLLDETVLSVKNTRNLILRRSAGHYLILPEGGSASNSDDFPVIDAMHVFGALYAVSADTRKIAWQMPLEHHHIRLSVTERSALIPNAPVLILLTRSGVQRTGTSVLRSHFGVKVINVRTGTIVYEDDDVGLTLNQLWMHLSSVTREVKISFDRRIITLTYPE